MSRYESAIGRFEAPNVDTLRPPLRKFSELPRWLEALSQLDLGSISARSRLDLRAAEAVPSTA